MFGENHIGNFLDVQSNPLQKKGFSKPDVTRLRNLIQGKSGERTTSGTGYSKAASDKHQEGDIWEESGRSWTIKNGIKENITKLDKFKSLTRIIKI